MAREKIQHRVTFLFAASGREFLTQNHLRAGIMRFRAEQKAAAIGTARQCPSRQGVRDLDDILLGVAAIDTHRMQFHQLAGVILIEPALTLPELRDLRTLLRDRDRNCGRASSGNATLHGRNLAKRRASAVSNTLPIVQVVQHCRTLGDRAQKVAKSAKRMRTNRLRVVLGEEVPCAVLACEYVEMVLPEVHHHFIELSL